MNGYEGLYQVSNLGRVKRLPLFDIYQKEVIKGYYIKITNNRKSTSDQIGIVHYQKMVKIKLSQYHN